MKYAVISYVDSSGHEQHPPRVLHTYRWEWRALLRQRALRFLTGCVTEIASIDDDPQVIVNICEQRDAAIRAEDRAKLLLHQALLPLASLVARDENGAWTTVHDVDTVVGYQDEISEVLA